MSDQAIEAMAEQIYEFICANTPDGKSSTWPHSPFNTLTDSAQHHYRCAARFALNESNRRAELIAVKLSYSRAEFLTRPNTPPIEAITSAMQYAGLKPIKIEVEIDGKVIDDPRLH